jgi:hypothetical protein
MAADEDAVLKETIKHLEEAARRIRASRSLDETRVLCGAHTLRPVGWSSEWFAYSWQPFFFKGDPVAPPTSVVIRRPRD